MPLGHTLPWAVPPSRQLESTSKIPTFANFYLRQLLQHVITSFLTACHRCVVPCDSILWLSSITVCTSLLFVKSTVTTLYVTAHVKLIVSMSFIFCVTVVICAFTVYILMLSCVLTLSLCPLGGPSPPTRPLPK